MFHGLLSLLLSPGTILNGIAMGWAQSGRVRSKVQPKAGFGGFTGPIRLNFAIDWLQPRLERASAAAISYDLVPLIDRTQKAYLIDNTSLKGYSKCG
jgi:hypothetical protein